MPHLLNFLKYKMQKIKRKLTLNFLDDWLIKSKKYIKSVFVKQKGMTKKLLTAIDYTNTKTY